MEEISTLLEKLNFSKTEAAVYINLLKHSRLNGYQIAKNLNMSRSSVYSALDNLYKRGVVFLLPGDSKSYKPEKPNNLINKLKKDFKRTTDLLETKLNEIEPAAPENRYLNIEGYDNIISKTKEILLTAEKEVYINTDFDLQSFAYEFVELGKRGVRIIVFSFCNLNIKALPIELYNHNDSNCSNAPTRIMLVVDCKTTIIADRSPQRAEFIGTFTDNVLLTSIVSEHIHNDIYILKLKNKYKKNLIDENIKINTILENRNCV